MTKRNTIIRISAGILGIILLVVGGILLFRAGFSQGMLSNGLSGSEAISPYDFNHPFGMGLSRHRGMLFLPVLFSVFLIIVGFRWLMRSIFRPAMCFGAPFRYHGHPGHYKRMHRYGHRHADCCPEHPMYAARYEDFMKDRAHGCCEEKHEPCEDKHHQECCEEKDESQSDE